ncbi:MAG: RNA polymerase factor sigma-54 [Spirochaetaceae bacterium]|jgi:RNA polymerase sigma-54 factor|nr:RNA polymerase factor sigma-54 [Spirochaetaceae bacterium]
MSGIRLEISQRQKQHQTLKLSPQMLQTISILSMPAVELREYMYSEAEKNPALEIVRDEAQETQDALRESLPGDERASDEFQAFIENRPARGITLQNHLLEQLALLPLGAPEKGLCEKIIGSLDSRGFLAVSPRSILDPANPLETPALLDTCLGVIRRLDPVGAACADSYESLYVQARLSGKAPPLALFILDGRLKLLENAKRPSMFTRINALIKEDPQKAAEYGLPRRITEEAAEEALDFIKGLDPFPARAFDAGQTVYISPDVYVTRESGESPEEPPGARFRVTFARDKLPELSLSPGFSSLSGRGKQPRSKKAEGAGDFARSYIREARQFLDAVKQREETIVRAAEAIVKAQIPFFERGPRFLQPLKMKDLAEAIDVHEATVSRIANGKYLQCEWGLFEIRYFFSNQVSLSSPGLRSKASVKEELRELLQAHEGQARDNPKAKRLTDEALAAMLKERGVTIARRTVAKYRAELNIRSSFGR